ncbi:MAG: hypothetical protein ACRDTH_02420 [Pseudonocardiaceae bacterium]
MREPLVQIVAGQPRPRLSPLVAGYTGYRIEGAEPGVHHGMPSRHLTFIVTLSGTVDLATMPLPTQPSASFVSLASGLHADPVPIRHGGHQHGIQLGLTPLARGYCWAYPPVSWPPGLSIWAHCWGRRSPVGLSTGCGPRARGPSASTNWTVP